MDFPPTKVCITFEKTTCPDALYISTFDPVLIARFLAVLRQQREALQACAEGAFLIEQRGALINRAKAALTLTDGG